VFGGVSINTQIAALRREPEIVVGCPGRILDLLGQRALRLARVETLVLDEADHMFDMGFLPDLRRILAALPAKRQNLLFSATMPQEIRQLADAVLVKPFVVELATRAPAATIDHALYAVAEDRKRDLLERILAGDDCSAAIVFTRTKHRARRLAEQLDKRGHRTVALQGNMSQAQRDRAMSGFRDRR
jgi:superfamily II DNA/RNA helicase